MPVTVRPIIFSGPMVRALLDGRKTMTRRLLKPRKGVEFIGAGPGGPCPALEYEGGRTACGLVRRPGHYLGAPAFADEIIGAMIAQALGVGRGCDSDAP